MTKQTQKRLWLWLKFFVLLTIFTSFWTFFEKRLISNGKHRRNRKGRMSLSEIMTILILFHQSQMTTFKDFDLRIVYIHYRFYFPNLLSYNRLLEWIPRTLIPFTELFFYDTRTMYWFFIHWFCLCLSKFVILFAPNVTKYSKDLLIKVNLQWDGSLVSNFMLSSIILDSL